MLSRQLRKGATRTLLHRLARDQADIFCWASIIPQKSVTRTQWPKQLSCMSICSIAPTKRSKSSSWNTVTKQAIHWIQISFGSEVARATWPLPRIKLSTNFNLSDTQAENGPRRFWDNRRIRNALIDMMRQKVRPIWRCKQVLKQQVAHPHSGTTSTDWQRAAWRSVEARQKGRYLYCQKCIDVYSVRSSDQRKDG